MRVNETEAVFENPQHDVPQNVRDMKGSAAALYAAVDGTVGGATRRGDFRYARTACEK